MTSRTGGHARANRGRDDRIPCRMKQRRIKGAALVTLALLTACGTDSKGLTAVRANDRVRLASPAFDDHEAIPARFTCDGKGISPPLRWSKANDVSEYALTIVDLDAPGGSFVHWVVWHIPPSTTTLGAGDLPSGATQGTNGFGDVGYGPPCPPQGDEPHDYVFRLYAVNEGATDELEPGASAEELLRAI